MMKLVKDRVAVTPIFDADTSPGGIIIPDIAKERCDQGIVKYIGPEVKDIKIGMYVLFSGYTGTLVHIAGEGSVIVMPEEFIVAELDEIENVYVPGLYYKSRVDEARRHFELMSIMHSILEKYAFHIENFKSVHDELAQGMAKYLVKEGIYGPQSSPYYQADYENILGFIADAFKDRQFKVKVPKPEWKDKGMVSA